MFHLSGRRRPRLILALIVIGCLAAGLTGCDRNNHSPGTTWSDTGHDSLSMPGFGAGRGAGWVGRGGAP